MMTAVVMILRVWAMYNRSTLILRVLLATFSLEIISNIIAAVVTSKPADLLGTLMLTEHMMSCTNKPSITTPLVCRLTVVVTHIHDYSACTVQLTSSIWTQATDVLQITHGATVCILGNS